MTALSLPINAKYGEPKGLTNTPEYGVIPAILTYPFRYTSHAASGGTSGVRIAGLVPKGLAVYDMFVNASSYLVGTSGATMTIGFGVNTVISNTSLNTDAMMRAATSTLGFGSVRSADTTISITLATSAAASLGQVTDGGGNIYVTVGVPFDVSSRG